MDNNQIDGVLLIDKEPDMTSHDVVAIARRSLNMKKIGHCGTLDPMATGLLILVLGKGTKMSELLMSEDKEYEGTLKLGETTNTQDKEGEIQAVRDVPEFSEDEIKDAFNLFKGDFYQTPPMVSAIKKDGVPLYKLARKGQEVEREPRFVHVYKYGISRVELPEVDFTVMCTKGFYVRTYAHDIGNKLGCGAHLSALRRTKSGRFDLSKSITASELKHGNLEDILKSVLTLPEVSRMRGA